MKNLNNLLKDNNFEVDKLTLEQLLNVFGLYFNLKQLTDKTSFQILNHIKKMKSFDENITNLLLIIGLNSIARDLEKINK